MAYALYEMPDHRTVEVREASLEAFQGKCEALESSGGNLLCLGSVPDGQPN